MRLHRLELTAFGPFGQRQVVDFDALTEAGLFLLHGPTGAGKTSVLDAVCFALYGRVPGARGPGARLRSDHAAEGAVPEVVCELTVSGRRFEVTRAAEHERAKRRGVGLIKEQARVVLRELKDGQWQPVSHRIDETADLLQRLIGLGPEQFTTLALLPQGEFATFLRAKPDDRKPLLQKLFGTDRFESVEAWLVARRRELKHEVDAAGRRVTQLLARAEQAHAAVRGDEATEAVGDDALELVDGWLAEARAEAVAAHARVAVADPAEDSARRAFEAGARIGDLRDRHADLLRQQALLAAAGPEQERRRARSAEAVSATVIVPVLCALAAAEATLAEAVSAATAAEALATSASTAAEVAGSDPDERLSGLHAEQGRLTELVRLAGEVEELDRGIHIAAQAAAQARDRLEQQLEAAAAVAVRQAELAGAREAAALLAGGLADRDDDLARAREVARAVRERDRAAERLREQNDAVATAFGVYRSTAEAALELRERRLDGMAAELARDLADGDACPVCGSAEHPEPAAANAEPVTRAAEEAAARRRDAAEQALRAREQEAATARVTLAALTVAAGELDADQAATRLSEAAQRQAEAAEAATSAIRLAAEQERAEAERSAAAAAAEQARAQARAAEDRVSGLTGSRGSLDRRLGGRTSAQVRAEAASVTGQVTAWQQLAEARRALAAAQEGADATASTAAAAIAEAGFADVEAARGAVLPEPEQARLRAAIAGHDEASARLRAQLADGELAAAAAAPAPDLAELEAGFQLARAERAAAADRHAHAARAVAELGKLRTELAAHLAATASLRQRFAVVDPLAGSVEGSTENLLRMRLSAYVLASRLEQVAQAASLRLATMTDGRYTVRHCDDRARGGARSGLGLLVLDAWTGAERDPATLSGGETFCTSLALALGLADVVSAESGGLQLETLLVDEGFGSLDEDTLEQVMDVLDGLRSGGRAVGLVSHVADLRQRIPAQLEVVKTRTGSSIRQNTRQTRTA